MEVLPGVIPGREVGKGVGLVRLPQGPAQVFADGWEEVVGGGFECPAVREAEDQERFAVREAECPAVHWAEDQECPAGGLVAAAGDAIQWGGPPRVGWSLWGGPRLLGLAAVERVAGKRWG